MVLQNKLITSLVILSTLFVSVSQADIQFPEDELPSESVIPILDSPKAVINRTVTYTGRWEPKLSYGFLLDEPFYQNSFLSLAVGYSWTEFSGVSLRYLKWGSGLSDYAKQMEGTATALKFGRAPGPDMGYSLSYDYRFFYGKVSFSKRSIIPTVLGSTFEGGMIKYGSKNLPFFGAGLINSYFFSDPGAKSHWGVNIGVRLYLRSAVDPLSANLSSTSGPVPSEGDFATKTRFSTSLDLGAQYLF